MMRRRDMLKTFAGLAVVAGARIALPQTADAANAATTVPKRLAATTRILEVNGKPARVFGLSGPDGKAGIRLAPGERFRVKLANDAGVRTIVHWHGQLPPWTEDGFPWPQTPPLAPGGVHAYDFAPIPGTFWMHSHQGLQEQRLMAAPLIVHDAAELREDRQEIVLMLHDFSFRAPDELLAGLTDMSAGAVHRMAREVENAPAPPETASAADDRAAGMGGAGMMGMMGGSGMGRMMAGMRRGGMRMMNPNEVVYDAFLANDRTLADPQIVRVPRAGRVRLRLINGASASHFWIDLGALTGRVVAADGRPVRPVAGRRFPLAIAQRLDILLDLPGAGAFPLLAQLQGSRRRTGIVLATPGAAVAKIAEVAPQRAPAVDNSLERRLSATEPPAPRPADRLHRMVLSGGMMSFAWSINGERWPDITPLMVKTGERVEFELQNHSMMPHPMHLHGHAFQVIAINGRPLLGAVRDTVLVEPMMGSVRIAFDAGNPGRWAFHCHNLYHMMTGMMTVLRYRGIAV
ncbi:MAG TPA: multicopper oxidase family protein [Stellaceae bacterium]|nr:multicopper oxidase family protein [Stellaceae bacterium]